MTPKERRLIREAIARDKTKSPRERLQALRDLEAMERDSDGIQPTAQGFDALDNVAPIRKKKAT